MRHGPAAWLQALREMPNDSVQKTLIVAVAVSLVCSVVVTSTVVLLKPIQQGDIAVEKQKNILEVLGMLEEDKSMDTLFRGIEAELVDLATGDYVRVDNIDPNTYDAVKAAADPELSIPVPPDRDVANIGAREKYATVYLLRHDNKMKYLILPVRGLGMYSTLYGMLALEADANTVFGFSIYQHAETPGLGGKVDDPNWRALWTGKAIYDESGVLRIQVIKGSVDANKPGARYEVDGLTGATMTSRGVNNMLRYWLGDDGYGPFLKKLRSARG
jgi:Na+-transporting NADH:ubiquinone oxidoreductase subunit C